MAEGRGVTRVDQQPVAVSADSVARLLQQRIAEDALTIAMLRAHIEQIEAAGSRPTEEPK